MKTKSDDTCLFSLVDGFRVVWELTHRCNYGCKHCSVDAFEMDSADENHSNELNTEEVKQGLTNLHNMGMKSIYYSGGEPILRDDFFEIVDHTKSLDENMVVNFASNGKAIDLPKAVRIQESGINSVLISLDGPNSLVVNQLRGNPLGYYYATNAMDLLSKLRIKIRMGVVIWEGNKQYLEDFLKIGMEKGVDNVFYNWFVPAGRGEENQSLGVSPSEYFKIADQIKELKAKYAGKINVGYHRFEEIDNNSNGCFACKNILHVLPDGIFTPCSWIYKADKAMVSSESINSNNFENIINDPLFSEIRMIINQREEQFGSGCIAMSKVFAGDFMTYDPLHKEKGLWVKKYKGENK